MASSHTSREFESELRELRANTLAMGARCERSLRLALDAFWKGSHEIAQEVKALDRHIDRDEMEIDALVLRVLALRQPVAHDLRVLTTALKLVTDLERIGDEAVNIAERAEERAGWGPTVGALDLARSDLREMSEGAQQLLRDALDAFVDGEVVRAERVRRGDDAVDALYGKTLVAMTEYMSTHPGEIPAAIGVIKVAKYIERVADHATNIAEEVIFMVGGEDVRHSLSDEPPAAFSGEKN
ncbi:MAG TPA: phosphate signaling complex protein PhoU [Polyangiaceae bacterium]